MGGDVNNSSKIRWCTWVCLMEIGSGNSVPLLAAVHMSHVTPAFLRSTKGKGALEHFFFYEL